MSKNRYVNTHFWDDNYVIELDSSEKLLFLYFLTNPLTNIAGGYEISLRQVALHTGYDREIIVKILARFEADDKIIYRDGWVLLVNSLKHQSLNPNIEKGIEESLQKSPDWIKNKVINTLQTYGKGFERLYKALKYLILFNSILSNSNGASDTPSAQPEEDFSSATEEFLSAVKVTYNSAILSREDRWLETIEKAIVGNIPLPLFIGELKKLLDDKGRKFPITPENVLTAAIERRANQSAPLPNIADTPKFESRSAEMEARGLPKMRTISEVAH